MVKNLILRIKPMPARVRGFLNMSISFYKGCSHEKNCDTSCFFTTLLLNTNKYRRMTQIFVNTFVVFEAWSFFPRFMVWL